MREAVETLLGVRLDQRLRGSRNAILHKDPPCAIECIPGLYVGSFISAREKSALERCGIKYILTVGSLMTPSFPKDFVYKIVKIADKPSSDLFSLLPTCFAFIQEGLDAGGVLVHCMAGISRSVSIAAAFVMKTKGVTCDDALARIKEARPCALPNSGFYAQLKLLQCNGDGDDETATEITSLQHSISRKLIIGGR
eukprot:Colp12_sorted_trinity150504_noHs@28008